MLKMGLLFETFGFLLSSFFLSLLNIAAINHIADWVRDVAVRMVKKHNESELGHLLINVMLAAGLRYTWSAGALRGSIDNWVPKKPHNKIKQWQYPILIVPAFLHILLALYLTLLTFASIGLYKLVSPVNWAASKVAEGKTLANSMIIVGGTILLAGLIMQLIAAW